jgi:hypothetical protein
LGQKIAEGTELLRSAVNPPELAGNLGYHAGQYLLGRAMNSPNFVDWLMRDSRLPTSPGETSGTGIALPAAAASAAQVKDPRTGPLGQPNFYSEAYLRSKAAFDALRAKQTDAQ